MAMISCDLLVHDLCPSVVVGLGALQLRMYKTWTDYAKSGFLRNTHSKSDARGLGCGSSLLKKEGCAIASEERASAIRIFESRPEGQARSFCKLSVVAKLNFVKVDRPGDTIPFSSASTKQFVN